MSNIYIQEPPTTGKVVMKTSVGEVDLELWTKEAPKACKNFIQLCMEGYYDGTIFHRVVKGFIVQGGDPTGTGEGGESIYGSPFKDEFHTRLRFCRRGLLAMANAGKDDNGSQFFFTLGATPELQNKHTIFGKVTGETIYNMLKLEQALVDNNERPVYPQKIIKTDVITNPFRDIQPRESVKNIAEEKTKDDDEDDRKKKKSGVKNFKLLSFGQEAEEDEEETVVLSKQYSVKGKSAHDNLEDPKLSSVPAVDVSERSRKRKNDNDDSDSHDESPRRLKESDDEEATPETNQAREMRERIKRKLKDGKTKQKEGRIANEKSGKEEENTEIEEVEEEYYLGKDRVDERKKEAEAIRKEIRDLKRGVRNDKKAKEAVAKEKVEAEVKKEAKSELIKEYTETRVKYDEAKGKVPKKGASREDFTLQLLKKFRRKLQDAKEQASSDQGETSHRSDKEMDKDLEDDESWMSHELRCEDKSAVLAKDASTKDDDWFEIYDPRNPLNKRRRGESDKTRSRDK